MDRVTMTPPADATPLRSQRQWEAYARARLRKGTSVSELRSEPLPRGVDRAAVEDFVVRQAASLRRRSWLTLGVAIGLSFIGWLLMTQVDLADANWRDGRRAGTDAWVLGLGLLMTGIILVPIAWVRVARRPREY